MTDENTSTQFLTTLEILKRAELERAYSELVSDIGNVRNLTQNAEGIASVHSKYDELTGYINVNCNHDMNLPGIKVAIPEWMAQEESEVQVYTKGKGFQSM